MNFIPQEAIEAGRNLNKVIIRWAGSKRKLLPILVEHLPKNFNVYLEPFCGSATLFFKVRPKKAILSDNNLELINALNELKKTPAIYNQLINIKHSSEEYYSVRALAPELLNQNERAVRFFYLNRYCFNGVYRTNRAGKYNVPIGTRTGTFPPEELFIEAHKALSNAEILCLDYKTCLKKANRNDFVYLDPPYSPIEKFTGEYGTNSFNFSDISDLAQTLVKLDKKEVKFLLSYRNCEKLKGLLPSHFLLIELNVNRHVSGKKKKWSSEKEILIKNYEHNY